MTLQVSKRWDVEPNGYINSVYVTRRPSVVLEVLCYVAREVLAGRAHDFDVCRGMRGHFGAHTPKYWGAWEKTARRRWSRFFRESLIPYVSVKPEPYMELAGWHGEGYSVDVSWVWVGRSWEFKLGRKLSPAYDHDCGIAYGRSAVDRHFGEGAAYLPWPVMRRVAEAETMYEESATAANPTAFQKGFAFGVEMSLEDRLLIDVEDMDDDDDDDDDFDEDDYGDGNDYVDDDGDDFGDGHDGDAVDGVDGDLGTD